MIGRKMKEEKLLASSGGRNANFRGLCLLAIRAPLSRNAGGCLHRRGEYAPRLVQIACSANHHRATRFGDNYPDPLWPAKFIDAT
jgi:hypothetical protein